MRNKFVLRFAFLVSILFVCCFCWYWQKHGGSCTSLNLENFNIIGIKEYYFFLCLRFFEISLGLSVCSFFYQIYKERYLYGISFLALIDGITIFILVGLVYFVLPALIMINFMDIYFHVLYFNFFQPLGLSDVGIMDFVHNAMDSKDVPLESKQRIPDLKGHAAIVIGRTSDGQSYGCVNIKEALKSSTLLNATAKSGLMKVFDYGWMDEIKCYPYDIKK